MRCEEISAVFQQVPPLNPLNAQLNPICHLLALLGAHHILHVSRIRVKHPVKYHLRALLEAHHILHVRSIRVKRQVKSHLPSAGIKKLTIFSKLAGYGLNTQLSPICHLLALLGAHHILHISRIKVNTDTV